MRTLLTYLLLAVAVLAAPSQAQPVDICDRTPEVRDAILQTLGAGDCANVERLGNVASLDLTDQGLTALQAGDFDGLTNLKGLGLSDNQLTALPVGVFDSLTNLVTLELDFNRFSALPAGVFDSLTSLRWLSLHNNALTTLPAGVFEAAAQLQYLYLQRNELTALPAGVFDGLTRLERARLSNNRFTTLPAGAFAGLANLEYLTLFDNQLAALPADTFDDATRLETLHLDSNQLTALPVGVFDDLISLEFLHLDRNQLTALPAGAFDYTTNLEILTLRNNRLTVLPAGVFNGMAHLQLVALHDNWLTTLPADAFAGMPELVALGLAGNRLTALPPDVFDGSGLQDLNLRRNRFRTLPPNVFHEVPLRFLHLQDNQLTTLPPGVFDNQPLMRLLDLRGNHLVGLAGSDPLFAGVASTADVRLAGQTAAPRPGAAVPLMLSASGAGRQGFVRIVNESGQSGSVRVSAFDDGGYAPDPIEFQLHAGKAVHFNSNDLENGNASKGIEDGIGTPIQGHWRLDVDTALDVRVLAFVRTDDGFLTAMHDVLPRAADGRLVAQTFNPGSNRSQQSRLRLMNTGTSAESVSIEGVDDQGAAAGPVTLTLAAGESRTLSALDLENGAQGLTGTLGDGAGKWRLLVAAGEPVVGVNLLEAASGHLTNTSTATRVVNARRLAVPLMPWASGSGRQGFVRIVNESAESGSVRVFAFDDGGYAADPIEVRLDARQVVHFNSDDLENGNPDKGIARGIGTPVQGDWRLDVETALDVRVLAFIRTADGFLTAMHDVLPRAADGRLVAETFNPASNRNQISRLRLVNTGDAPESLRIEGFDDQGAISGLVGLRLAAGESRTLSALDLENGTQGLAGRLGDGAGKWRLFIAAGDSVVGMSLLEADSGHLTNISTIGGGATEGQ